MSVIDQSLLRKAKLLGYNHGAVVRLIADMNGSRQTVAKLTIFCKGDPHYARSQYLVLGWIPKEDGQRAGREVDRVELSEVFRMEVRELLDGLHIDFTSISWKPV